MEQRKVIFTFAEGVETAELGKRLRRVVEDNVGASDAVVVAKASDEVRPDGLAAEIADRFSTRPLRLHITRV